MISSKDLLERFALDGLTVRRIQELEANGVLLRRGGGRGRGWVSEYDDINLAAVSARLRGRLTVHWAIHGGIARQLIAKAEELRIQALLCESTLPDWASQIPSEDVAAQLIERARERGWYTCVFGPGGRLREGGAVQSLAVPFPVAAWRRNPARYSW